MGCNCHPRRVNFSKNAHLKFSLIYASLHLDLPPKVLFRKLVHAAGSHRGIARQTDGAKILDGQVTALGLRDHVAALETACVYLFGLAAEALGFQVVDAHVNVPNHRLDMLWDVLATHVKRSGLLIRLVLGGRRGNGGGGCDCGGRDSDVGNARSGFIRAAGHGVYPRRTYSLSILFYGRFFPLGSVVFAVAFVEVDVWTALRSRRGFCRELRRGTAEFTRSPKKITALDALRIVLTNQFVERRDTDFYEYSGCYERTDAFNYSPAETPTRLRRQEKEQAILVSSSRTIRSRQGEKNRPLCVVYLPLCITQK